MFEMQSVTSIYTELSISEQKKVAGSLWHLLKNKIIVFQDYGKEEQMANYSNELLNAIREDRKNGLTYNEIMLKHDLASNNAIKIALGKTLGGDSKYKGRHKERYHKLVEIEKKYYTLVNLTSEIKKELEVITLKLEDMLSAFTSKN